MNLPSAKKSEVTRSEKLEEAIRLGFIQETETEFILTELGTLKWGQEVVLRRFHDGKNT